MRARITLFLGLIVLVMFAIQVSTQSVSNEFCSGAGAAAVSPDGKVSISWPLPQRVLEQSKIILKGNFTNRGECRLRLSRFPFKTYCTANFQVTSSLRGPSDVNQVEVHMENPSWARSPEHGPFPTVGEVVVFGNLSIFNHSDLEIENCAYLPIDRQYVTRADVQDYLRSKGILETNDILKPDRAR